MGDDGSVFKYGRESPSSLGISSEASANSDLDSAVSLSIDPVLTCRGDLLFMGSSAAFRCDRVASVGVPGACPKQFSSCSAMS